MSDYPSKQAGNADGTPEIESLPSKFSDRPRGSARIKQLLARTAFAITTLLVSSGTVPGDAPQPHAVSAAEEQENLETMLNRANNLINFYVSDDFNTQHEAVTKEDIQKHWRRETNCHEGILKIIMRPPEGTILPPEIPNTIEITITENLEANVRFSSPVIDQKFEEAKQFNDALEQWKKEPFTTQGFWFENPPQFFDADQYLELGEEKENLTIRLLHGYQDPIVSKIVQIYPDIQSQYARATLRYKFASGDSLLVANKRFRMDTVSGGVGFFEEVFLAPNDIKDSRKNTYSDVENVSISTRLGQDWEGEYAEQRLIKFPYITAVDDEFGEHNILTGKPFKRRLEIITADGRITLYPYDEMKKQNPKITPDDYIQHLAEVLVTDEAMAAWIEFMFEYVPDSPNKKDPFVIGSKLYHGDYTQTPEETVQRIHNGRMQGDCDDLPFLIQEILRIQGKSTHTISIETTDSDGVVGHIFTLSVEQNRTGKYRIKTYDNNGLCINGVDIASAQDSQSFDTVEEAWKSYERSWKSDGYTLLPFEYGQKFATPIALYVGVSSENDPFQNKVPQHGYLSLPSHLLSQVQIGKRPTVLAQKSNETATWGYPHYSYYKIPVQLKSLAVNQVDF